MIKTIVVMAYSHGKVIDDSSKNLFDLKRIRHFSQFKKLFHRLNKNDSR
jgi:hypothetical protein